MVIGLIVLSRPLLNAVGITDHNLPIWEVKVTVTLGLIMPLLILSITILYAYLHPNKTFWDLLLDSAGFPGLLLAGLLHATK
jgi:hypothetical protein